MNFRSYHFHTLQNNYLSLIHFDYPFTIHTLSIHYPWSIYGVYTLYLFVIGSSPVPDTSKNKPFKKLRGFFYGDGYRITLTSKYLFLCWQMRSFNSRMCYFFRPSYLKIFWSTIKVVGTNYSKLSSI